MTSRHQNVAWKQWRSAMTWILKDINDICVWFESHSNYMVKLFIRILKIIKGIWSLKSFVAILSRFGKCIEVDQYTLWFDLRIYNATLKWMTPLYQQLCYIHSIQGRRRRGGRGGHEPHTFKSGGGGTSGFVPPPPTFGQSKCSNFTICSYFVVKTHFFSKFSWLASLANFNKTLLT